MKYQADGKAELAVRSADTPERVPSVGGIDEIAILLERRCNSPQNMVSRMLGSAGSNVAEREDQLALSASNSLVAKFVDATKDLTEIIGLQERQKLGVGAPATGAWQVHA